MSAATVKHFNDEKAGGYSIVEETAKPDTRSVQAANAVVDEVAGQFVNIHWEPSAFPGCLRYLFF